MYSFCTARYKLPGAVDHRSKVSKSTAFILYESLRVNSLTNERHSEDEPLREIHYQNERIQLKVIKSKTVARILHLGPESVLKAIKNDLLGTLNISFIIYIMNQIICG